MIAVESADVEPLSPLLDQAESKARKAQLLFAAGAICYGVGTNVALHVTEDLPWLPVQAVLLTLMFAWPGLPTLLRLSPPSRRRRQLIWLGYLVVLAGLLVIGGLSAVYLLGLIALFVGLPAVFVLATSASALRGAAWLVAPALMMLAPVLLILLSIATYVRISAGTPYFDWGFFLGITGACLALLLIVVLYGWCVLRAYKAKWASDQTLLLLQWWFVAALWTTLILGARSSSAALLSMAPFALLLLILLAAALTRRPGTDPPVRLLLLRTFGARGRSTRLLRQVTARWRWIGSVELIIAPDVASETLEPNIFLDFISGRLPARFVRDVPGLQRRLANLDLLPYRDGRYRINELMCHDDTWRPTVEALVSTTHAVLLDLRGFSPANAGVAYELERLVALVPLQRVVAVVDASTNMHALQAALASAAASAPETSLLADDPSPVLRTVSVGTVDGPGSQQLLGALARAASSFEREH